MNLGREFSVPGGQVRVELERDDAGAWTAVRLDAHGEALSGWVFCWVEDADGHRIYDVTSAPVELYSPGVVARLALTPPHAVEPAVQWSWWGEEREAEIRAGTAKLTLPTKVRPNRKR